MRARRFVRGMAALVLLAGLLVGVPALLVSVAGFPLPTAMPTADQVGEALGRSGIPASTIVKAVAVVVWMGWLQLAAGVAAALVEQLRRRPVRHVPAAAPVRRVAASLVAAVVALAAPLSALSPASAASRMATSTTRVTAATTVARSGLPSVPVATGPGTTAAGPGFTPAGSASAEAGLAAAVGTAPAGTPAATLSAAPPLWVVQPRDTLWGIAEATLGEGQRWREVLAVNAGREVAPGVVLPAGGQLLRAGWVLRLPAGATVVQPVLGAPAGSTEAAPVPGTPGAAAAVPSRLAGRVAVDEASPASAPVLAPARQVVKVRPGDTLVAIAARVYGDGARWRELWRANRGRQFGKRTFDDPNLILAGWDLDVPLGDPALPAPSTQPTSPTTSPIAEPAPGSASEPSEVAVAGHLGTAWPGRPAVATTLASASSSGGSDAAGASFSNPAAPATGAGAVSALPAVPAPAAGAPVTESGDHRLALASGLAGAALLATGVTGMVASRRRRRLERAAPRSAVPAPDPDLVAIERQAKLGADPLGMARLDVALRALAASSAGLPARPVVVQRTVAGDLDVVLAGPASLPGPWVRGLDDRTWSLPGTVPLSALASAAAGVAAPCPAMVQLGVGDASELYLDLEAAGTVVLDGPPVAGRAIARAVIAGLAVSPLADHVQVVAAGTDCFGFANEERVQAVADASAALEIVGPGSVLLAQELERASLPSTFALRAARPDELWEPSVVVAVGGAAAPGDVAELARLAGTGGRGLALLTDAPIDAGKGWRLVLDGGGWRLDPLGASVVPQGLAADELADLGAVVADAAVPVVAAAPVAIRPPTAEPFVEQPWSLLVRVLGPVEVVDRAGQAVSFERSKALELVVWLAQHRVRPTRTGARTALWEGQVRDATFANVVSDARRALARQVPPPDQEEWIARTYVEDLPLHPHVVTDADLLAARLEHARRQPDRLAVETLREGLELVRDVPYAGTTYLWPDDEALPSHLTLLVVDAAVELATRQLAAGDVEGVFWATTQGMRALPGHEELVCLRLRAHALRGNLAGVRREFESYERAVTSDPWGDGEPSPKVVAARSELLRAATA